MYSYLKFYAQGAQMKSINMSGRGGNIFDSDFSNAKIEDSFFNRFDFRNCDLHFAVFHNVSFGDCYFYRLITQLTRFENCDFTQAYMTDFTFDNCVFSQCNFTRCDMENVVFKSCSFIDCDFKGAELPPFFYPHQMIGCKNIPYMPMACPEEGEIIGYKIASSKQIQNLRNFLSHRKNLAPANVLVTLKIPDDAKRSSAGGRKCRCDKAMGLLYPREELYRLLIWRDIYDELKYVHR